MPRGSRGPAHLYVDRPAEAVNDGQRRARACPCSLLLLLYDDDTFDGWVRRTGMCPRCLSGWVWDEAYPQSAGPPDEMSPEGA